MILWRRDENVAAMVYRDPFAQCQPQTYARFLGLMVQPVEHSKDRRAALRRDTHAIVAHVQQDHRGVLMGVTVNVDFAGPVRVTVFDRVAGQTIDQAKRTSALSMPYFRN